MEIDNLTILIITIISVLTTLVAYFLIRNLKKSGYDRQLQQAKLDDIRHALEKQMYGISDRLVQNEERWKDVNHLLLREKSQKDQDDLIKPRKISLNNFLQANGIRENNLAVDEKFIFILTPFHSKYYDQYMLIKDICVSMGYNCQRGDEEYFDGDIFPQVLKKILKARLVIANINGRNSNVLYELGVAQALDKKVILMAQSDVEFPVDIKSQRFLIYKDSEDLRSLLKSELNKLR
jgi:hypothetical protein